MTAGNNLKFPTRIAGNDNGQFDGEKYKAIVSGRYQIRLHLVIYGGSEAYHYYVYMRRSGSVIHYLHASGQRDPNSSYDSRHLSMEVDLEKDQTIYFYIAVVSSGINYHSYSVMEGKLIKLK